MIRVCSPSEPTINRCVRTKDIKPLREAMLIEQHFCCAICGDFIGVEKNKAVLDHDHKTGHVRAVNRRLSWRPVGVSQTGMA